ncbi:MAG: transporter substrate-binding domain-containing protein [SAR324 cluster bacterium]|nr:transporter substrate-binding domain-containing protein [SAR324 cluster bacterium]
MVIFEKAAPQPVIFRMILPLIILTTYALSVSAEDKPSCPSEPISFGLYENGFIFEKESDDGIDKAIAMELERRSGCKFALIVAVRARIWKELESGDMLMSGSGIQNAERDKFAWFIRIMGQKNYAMVLNEVKAVSSNDYLKMNLQTQWGAIRLYKHGQAADKFLDELRQQNRVHELTDMDTLFKMLSNERINAGFAPPPVYQKYIKQYHLDGKVRIEDWFPSDASIPHCLIFSKKHFSATEMKKWNSIVRGMKEDGTLEQIYAKYLGKSGARRMMDYTEIMQSFE